MKQFHLLIATENLTTAPHLSTLRLQSRILTLSLHVDAKFYESGQVNSDLPPILFQSASKRFTKVYMGRKTERNEVKQYERSFIRCRCQQVGTDYTGGSRVPDGNDRVVAYLDQWARVSQKGRK